MLLSVPLPYLCASVWRVRTTEVSLPIAIALYQTLMTLPQVTYTKFTLGNGLRVVIHEDHKAPIVAVNVWYHVGSKNEPAGRSGFAHLFEHLMFNGSEHFNDDYFQAMERAGATELNGTTNRDRTNYFQNVPKSALDLALWMESDRMGHLLGAIDQAKLDEQRRVVKNEKRQGENQPYGQVHSKITHATYPKGHPYDHTVIGSMDDLDAATVEDVHEWFKSYYGPNNAVLAIAGDVTLLQAKALAEKYFGDIPPGPPVSQFESWVARRTGAQREAMQDRVPQARIYKVWNVPATFTTGYYRLGLAASVLASGMNSRFYKRLVYEDQIATGVSAYLSAGEIGSQFTIAGTAHPGKDLRTIEAALDEELVRFLADGPTEHELRRVVTEGEAQFIHRIERIGGFGGKSAMLAQGEVYRGDPGAYIDKFHSRRAATLNDVQTAARRWLSDGAYALEVHPFAPLFAAPTGVERDRLPAVKPPADTAFPAIRQATLSNGVKVLLVERRATPIVHMTLFIDAGFAADQHAIAGTASLAMSMLLMGTTNLSSLEISDRLAFLGASIGAGSNLDGSSVNLSALKEHLVPSLDLFADIILNPTFPQAEFDRVRQERLARIQSEKASPLAMALRVFPKLLYGDGHAYSLPLTGSGTEASVMRLDRESMVAFHQTWFRPDSATFVIVGDTTVEEVVPLLEARFHDWRNGSAPDKNIDSVDHHDAPSVYLVDRPGSVQSIVFAGHLAPPRNVPNNLAIETMNEILGGSFTSRINMNLREDKGWCYGAQSVVVTARGQRPFIVFASVQSDKTSESMQEILSELRGIRGDAPPTGDEVLKAQQSLTLTLAGRWETCSAVEDSLISMVQNNLPEDFYDTYAQRVRALDVAQVNAAAREVIRPESLVWVVVGDRPSIEPRLRALAFGPIVVIDADGSAVSSE